ncbi:cytochrome b, partial [Shewanella sp. C31]|nr:cytochrome b [Shewanella electrica]
MLRGVPDKLGGIVVLGMSIALLFVLAWLYRCKVKSVRFRILGQRFNLAQFAISFV